jgi:PAS domain S-box-containing protein
MTSPSQDERPEHHKSTQHTSEPWALSNPERLHAVQRYDAVEALQRELDRLTRMASQLYDVPIALVTLLKEERQEFICARGTDLEGVPAPPSVCASTIETEGPLVVEDLAQDDRFADEFYVTGELHLRFYAGAPLTTPDGLRIGTLCVYDTQPHSPDPKLRPMLQDLADMAMEALERNQFLMEGRPELSQTVIDNLPGIFYVVGQGGILRRWNARFETLSGYAHEALDERDMVSFFTGPDQTVVEQALKDVFDTGSVTVEARFTSRDDTAIPMLLTGVRARIKGELSMVGMGIDISERREREKLLQEAKEEAERQRQRAEEANASKSRFLRGVAHDLKSPVSGIRGFTELLSETLSHETLSQLEGIERATDQIDEIATSLQELARLDAGELELHTAPLEVRPLLTDLADDLTPNAEENGVHLQVASGSSPVWTRAHASSLRRAVCNLTENAIKYAGEGADITLGARVDADNGGERTAVVVIEDTGVGIDPSFMDRLFEPFARDAPDIEGTGLGLVIAKELVEAMNGIIDVESTPGEGTRFEIQLPAAHAPTVDDATVEDARDQDLDTNQTAS